MRVKIQKLSHGKVKMSGIFEFSSLDQMQRILQLEAEKLEFGEWLSVFGEHGEGMGVVEGTVGMRKRTEGDHASMQRS